MSEHKQRGGPGRGQGRKPIKEGVETVTVSIRMTTAQREKLETLGGAAWVRERIDRALQEAKAPTESPFSKVRESAARLGETIAEWDAKFGNKPPNAI